jgi:CheY-like chemotaxis protein
MVVISELIVLMRSSLALKNYKNGLYDLLLIDIIMPQMDGFKLSEKIRKVDGRAKICF